jgi:hypothetical protein
VEGKIDKGRRGEREERFIGKRGKEVEVMIVEEKREKGANGLIEGGRVR